jgi:aspartate aminotransferase/aminotransferase
MHDHWIADRMQTIEMSGIRKIFELGRNLKDPVNLSIGQPDFDVPPAVKSAVHAAIDRGDNGYTITQGIPELRDAIRAELIAPLNQPDREVLITSGTSGALLLALYATVNPGDEVIILDPYFVAYPHMITLAAGKTVVVDTYPDFTVNVDKIRAAITPRTKVILFSTPSNPTGTVIPDHIMNALAQLAAEKRILLISDEIYRVFRYEQPYRCAAAFHPDVLVVDGFGKTYGMTGWRLGFAHGPKAIINEMAKLQQFTFVCAPSVVQHGGVAALKEDTTAIVANYRQKRDLLCEGLRERFEFTKPGGAFYLFPKAPWGSATEFVTEAVRHGLLIIPGITFSKRDTHFRVSYAAKDETILRGIEILNRLARK